MLFFLKWCVVVVVVVVVWMGVVWVFGGCFVRIVCVRVIGGGGGVWLSLWRMDIVY